MLGNSLPPTQSALPTAPRSLRKRKRDEEINSPTPKSSPLGPNIRPESQQQKRPCTTCSTSQFPLQPAQNSAPKGTIVRGESQTRTNCEQLSSEPRRSTRIAQLQMAREKSGQSPKAVTTRKRKDNAALRATQPNKLVRSKRPNTLSPADSRHTRKGQNGVETRTRAGRR